MNVCQIINSIFWWTESGHIFITAILFPFPCIYPYPLLLLASHIPPPPTKFPTGNLFAVHSSSHSYLLAYADRFLAAPFVRKCNFILLRCTGCHEMTPLLIRRHSHCSCMVRGGFRRADGQAKQSRGSAAPPIQWNKLSFKVPMAFWWNRFSIAGHLWQCLQQFSAVYFNPIQTVCRGHAFVNKLFVIYINSCRRV